MSSKRWDVAIVGTGPAGMFAALELLRVSKKKLQIVMFEKGEMRKGTEPNCSITCGWGGSGAFSDGKLNHTVESGGQLSTYLSPQESEQLIEYVDKIYLEFGGDKKLVDPSEDAIADLKRKAAACDLKIIQFPIRHLGTDKSRIIVDKIHKHLTERGVTIYTKTEVSSISKNGDGFDLVVMKGPASPVTEWAHRVVVAPGREGAQWFTDMVSALGLRLKTNYIDIGVRVEVSNDIIQPVTDIVYELKVLCKTKSFRDDVRTFCMCPSGLVAIEEYRHVDGLKTVNGHTPKDKKLRSKNTNFAVLVSKTFTEPFKNSLGYAKSISSLANDLAGGGVLVQRLGDIKDHRRSTKESIMKNFVTPTLSDAVPGDLSLVLPARHMTSILEMLSALDKLIPGVYSDHTLLYGIEVKFYSNKVETRDACETVIDGLYVAGDGSGYTRGLMQASMHGVMVARKIVSK